MEWLEDRRQLTSQYTEAFMRNESLLGRFKRRLPSASIAAQLGFLALALVSAGCRSEKGLIKTGVMRVKTLPAKNVYFVSVEAFQREGGLVLIGFVSNWKYHTQVGGHVDFSLYDPNGKRMAIQSAELDVTFIAKGERSEFKTKVDVQPVAGATLVVAFHPPDTGPWHSLKDCGHNLALAKGGVP